MKAIRIAKLGGPIVLQLQEVELRAPKPDEIVVRNRAIGINFIDTYHRTGLYQIPLPSGLGLEGAGIVEAVGEGVTRFTTGDRVAYASGPIGAYAEAHLVKASQAVKLPEHASFDVGAAALLKGMTAQYLLKRTYKLQAGEFAMIYAAAGGVGQIAVQWAAHLGAEVIAIVGDKAKGRIAKGLGAQHVVLSAEDIARRVREITGGKGAHVAYDSVGKDTFEASLDSLRPLGMLVSFGNASGAPPAIEPGKLSAKGSLYLTRPTMFHYTSTEADLQATADDLFATIGAGIVKVAAPTSYKLADAAQAHRDLEARRTTGSLVLTP